MRTLKNSLGMVLAIILCMPIAAFAAAHTGGACNDCHKTGAASPRGITNVCNSNLTGCHFISEGGAFTSDKASDAMNSILGDPANQTSHFWGGSPTLKPAAGSTNPLPTFYSSRYNISTRRITCSICHDPHAAIGTKLLRKTKDNDLLCQQCHTGFYVNNAHAWKTHPIGDPVTATYAAAYSADNTKYQSSPPNDSAEGVTLINGFVSCSSCHAPHFADSDASTLGTRANVANLTPGDGHLLKGDGPSRLNKSSLCQTCHTYKEHGKVGNDAVNSGTGDVQIGCMVCHSGHSFDPTLPNYFVLRKSVDSGSAGFGSKTTLYTTDPTPWATYCVSCHGPVTGYTLRPHTLPADNNCGLCHAHNATSYSFGQASGGASCSGCHGAPPRSTTASNRSDGLPETGYAVGSNGTSYLTENYKDESQTPHKIHAGALETDKAAVDYAFGTGTTLSACLPCHNDKEDAVSPPSPSHDMANSSGSFQDVYFNAFVTYNGLLTSPLYKKTAGGAQWACSGIYCHSNGGKRPTTGTAKVLADFKTATTNAWPLGSTTNKIIGTATECQQCHGEDRASMVLAQKNNSTTHDKHLLKLGDGKTKCYLCHSTTVDNTGTIPASARDHRFGGTHVNGTPNVVFSTTAFGGDLAGGTYNGAVNAGTCTVYCHSDGNGNYATPDWDVTSTGACGTCHPATNATQTSSSHARHLAPTKANIKCDSCHGAGASAGTHSGHVDGTVTKLTTAASCDICHGVELGSGKAWDVSPTWGLNTSTDCRTCHTGSVVTSYVNSASVTISVTTVNNLSKPLHESDGHSRTTAYTLTGKPAGNKNCTACHITLVALGTGHVDGIGTSKLLIGGFSCEACHTAAGSRNAEATVDVQSHGNQTAGYTKKAYNAAFTKTCLACHDPHGTSNGAMIENLRTKQNAKDATANFAGNVVFSALTITNSFDESDTGASANNDDICATCHSTTLHNNRAAAAANHHEGENCTTTCHGHNGAKGGFMPSSGTACNDCHGNPPTSSDPRPADSVGAHAAHTKVGSHAPSEDLYDCAVCHQGGESFALDGAHSSAPLVAGIGYNAGDGTCSNACHLSTAGDGYWNDPDGLDCTSCHYYAASPSSAGNIVKPVSPTHNKHFDAGKVCIDCHANNSADAGAHPNIDLKRTHIDDHELWSLNATNDGTVLADRGVATQDEATVIVPTWSDGANTCSNAACHNPSGLSNTATWGNTNGVGCNFCHSSTNPDTGKGTPGSHGAHMNAAGTFGITTIACTSCHPNNTLNGHLNGAVNLNGGFTYSTSLTDYTSGTFGRCTTTTCHNNGKGVAVQTPVWGAASANCTICHNNGSGAAQPNTGRHNKHVANASYVASSCGNCHANATATTMTGATTHINGTAQTGVDITAHTAGTATCTNNCHLVDSARGDWLDANLLDCTDCHARSGSAGGAYPTSGLHTGTLTVSGNTHDNSFKVTKAEGSPSGTCLTCHTATPSTAHKTGTLAVGEVTVAATVGYLAGATPTCGPNGALVNCHDDKGIWKRRWSTTATASTGAECGNCHGNFDTTWVTGISQRHSSDAQIHGGHNGAGVNDCYICHTFGWAATYPAPIGTSGKHRDGSIQLNNGMLFNDDGATVHCTGCHDLKPLGLADGQYSFQDTNSADGADGGLNRWLRAEQAGPPANCNGCHAITNGLDHDGTNESLAVHDYHTGSPLSPGCGACHPADSGPGGTLHQNNTLDFGGTYLSLTNYAVTPGVGGNFANINCSTANGCHNSQDNSWKTDTLATCGDCHAAATKLMYTGSGLSGYPPTSNEHTQHIANNAYVGATASSDCDDCHGTGASAPAHLTSHNDGALTIVIAGSKITQLNADKSCTNSCHITANGRDWDSGTTLTCTDCHVAGSYIASTYLPTSGLHTGTLTTSANTHDDLFKTTRAEGAPGSATCATCHTTTPSTAHINGTFTNTYPTINFAAALGFADGATPTCGPNAGLVTCHDDDGDWKRKWSTTAKDAGDTRCANCHGDFTAGFTTGVVARHQTTSIDIDGQIGSSHGGADKCYTCHNYKSGSTTYYNFTTKHRDLSIQINSNASFVDNGATVGCTGCHVANDGTNDEQHSFTEASGVQFTRSLEAGPAAGCNSCHGGDYGPANSLNYWPGAAGATSPDRAGEHNAHMIKLVAKLGFNMGSLSDAEQKQMCAYCHTYTTSIGEGGHGDAAPSEVGDFNRIMDGLADTGTAGSFSGGNGTGGACATVDCHNNKTTPATHEWNDGATSACIMCHLDVTADTTHVAHTGAAALFGKTITCANCHDGTTNWGTNTPPSADHINGAFTATSYSGFTYPSVKGSCGVNTCHNNGKNAAAPAYTWGTPIAGCAACHATDSTLGSSHNPHLVASFATTFGKAANCQDCHDAVSAASMAGKTAHMDGAVTLAAGLTYSGTPGSLNVTVATTYGSCTGTCHNDGKGSTPATLAVWNGSYSNCNICHALPNTAGNDGARHLKHVNNTVKVVASCGECHLNATTTTYNSANHLSGAVNTGNKITAHTNGSATCTNNCHIVNAARGDWLDTAALGCTDCHLAGSYLASSNLPTSGLHTGTLTVSDNTHDDQFKNTKAEVAPGTAGCVTCHSATPSTAHINGTYTTSWNAAPPSINFATAVGFTDAATPTCGPNAALVNCHDDDGIWKRKWSITAKDAGDTRCANCHGDFTTGFTTGVVARHQTTTTGDADGQIATNHNGTDRCYTCHNYRAGYTTYYDFAVKHRDGAIQINDGSFVDNGSTVGCTACHAANDGTADEQHAFAEASGARFTRSLEPGVSAGCNTCHGVGGAGGNWPIKATDDAGTADDMNQDGEHSVHVLEIAKKLYGTGSPTIANQNSTCIYCHPGNGHGGADGTLPADVSRTDTSGDNTPEVEASTMNKIIGGGDDANGVWHRTTATCSNVACHASAPFTPHWYADTTPPGNVTLTAVAGPVPRSIKVTWTAVGDDGTDDGTAYKYDMRMSKISSADAINFNSTTNYVQGVPTVRRKGTVNETAIIHNVDPSTTYYFALRTYDRAGNYGGTANSGGYVSYAVSATPDTTAPVMTGSPSWYGLDSAKALDDGTVKLSWTRAEDHSMPITYDIWWSTGTITYGTVSASTQDTSFRVPGLTTGQTYNFAVRAKDKYNNRDLNTIVLQAIPQGVSAVPKTSQTHFSGTFATPNVTMNTSAYTGTAGSSTLTTGIYFIAGSTYHATASTDVFIDTFAVYIANTNTASTVTAEVGYYDTQFRSFTTALTKSNPLAARAKKVLPFKFGAIRTVAGGKKLAVKLTQTQAGTVSWGTATNRGDLTTTVQPVNVSPTTPTITTNAVSGANVSFYWAAATDTSDSVDDTVHYDVFGSANGGADGFPYMIASGLSSNATSGAPLVWDTQSAGIALSASVSNVQVRVQAGDTSNANGKTLSHTVATSGNLTVNNSGDNLAPGTITNFKAETRPKQGSIYLTWTAPGDDGGNNGRAASYDIRWSNAVIDNDTKYGTATPLVSEPYPDFGGNGQGYEVLDLADGTYYFAIKAVDDGSKTSPLAYTTATTDAGPKCGICHSTPPDESVSIGNHAKHGFTMAECGNCHGTAAASFTTDHQDGVIKLGWKTATPAAGTKVGYQITYTQGGQTIYQDASPGGFNVDSADTGDKTDSGSCSSWSTLGVSGCHGPASSASWTVSATLVCSACHGDSSRVLDDYGHSFDDPGVDIEAAPPIDNHGYDGTGATVDERKYVGAHTEHLNASFRMSKGDSCRLCHGASRPGASTHADGLIDIKLDAAAAGATATWTASSAGVAGTCGSLNADACHPSGTVSWDSNATFACNNCHGFNGVTPSHVTDPNGGVGTAGTGNCTWCHIGGHPSEKTVTAITNANPPVVTTANNHNLATNDKVTIHTQSGMTEINNVTSLVTVLSPTTFSLQGINSTGYGTFTSGSWIEGNGTGIILLPNDSRSGIAYRSGGVHLKANIYNRGEKSSEAELCWSCHSVNSISEWGADDGTTNTVTPPGNGNNYNYGTLNQTNWIGATWTSGTTGTYGFGYKSGTIKSTHSTDPTGTSALTGSAYGYTNGGVDAVNKIHCSNCHDVHNSTNSPLEADGLNPDGAPYLRGTWKSNPYKEDGAPMVGQTYTSQDTAAMPGYGYNIVPRANPSTTQAMGGYWIDQNSGNPTAGWSYETSAGLCQLCHSTTVDNLDQQTGENLWISATNGHANSVLGGSGTGAANIFFHGTGGRNGAGGGNVDPNPGVWMGFQINYTDSDDYGYGPRSAAGTYLLPYNRSKPKISVLVFAWGNTVDAGTTEIGYHQFSCSKCHNPHASRLPKLMITNCLDVTHNTWDNSYDTENDPDWADKTFNTAASSWGTKRISHLSTAQNCHRYIDVNGDNTPDEKGWNKVTPW